MPTHYTQLNIILEISARVIELDRMLSDLQAAGTEVCSINGMEFFFLEGLGYTVDLETGIATRENGNSDD